jgi:hypothetical protein
MALEELKTYMLQGTDQIPAELIRASGRIVSFETHKFLNFISNKKKMFK